MDHMAQTHRRCGTHGERCVLQGAQRYWEWEQFGAALVVRRQLRCIFIYLCSTAFHFLRILCGRPFGLFAVAKSFCACCERLQRCRGGKLIAQAYQLQTGRLVHQVVVRSKRNRPLCEVRRPIEHTRPA
ncbi:hypothetical protein TRVL_07838 [Trypanosoma vivax]|nr:hypothetical protein TRVL_07838 [Trypanosoma vivax]